MVPSTLGPLPEKSATASGDEAIEMGVKLSVAGRLGFAASCCLIATPSAFPIITAGRVAVGTVIPLRALFGVVYIRAAMAPAPATSFIFWSNEHSPAGLRMINAIL